MDNGAMKAFSLQYEHDGTLYVNKGLTKREYFAGLAMQGILSHEGVGRLTIDCQLAAEYADALLKALEVKDEKG